MERTGNGGFQGYRKLPTITPASSSSEMNLRVTSEMNHNMINGNNHNNGNHNGNYTLDQKEECTVREQDRFMPIANVIRIMRKILPSHAKISDDAKETIQECVSEYISFVTSEANERCQQEQRKTITAEDVLFAMSKLGFDDYIEPLTLYLHRYRELEGEQRSSIRDPLPLKRNANGVLEFAPPNYHHHHHHAFFGAGGAIGMGGGYVGHASNNNATSSSGAADPIFSIFPQSK